MNVVDEIFEAVDPPPVIPKSRAKRQTFTAKDVRALHGADILEPASKRPRLNITATWAAEITEELNVTWLVRDLIPAAASGVVSGEPGSGKTAAQLDMAMHGAANLPAWHGLELRPVRVAYLALENPRSIRRRVLAWCKRHGIAPETVQLLVIDAPVNLLFTDDVDTLIEFLIEQGGFDLLIVDTMARAMPGGDENSVQDMGKAIAALDRIKEELGLTWLAVHHSPKADPRGMRGSSALLGAIDVHLSVANGQIIVEKARDGESGGKYAFTIEGVEIGQDDEGNPVFAPVALASAAHAPKTDTKRLPAGAVIALDALRAAIQDHGQDLPHTSQIPPGKAGVPVETWRTYFARRYGEDKAADTTKKAWHRSREQLLGRRIAGIDGDHAWIW